MIGWGIIFYLDERVVEDAKRREVARVYCGEGRGRSMGMRGGGGVFYLISLLLITNISYHFDGML